MPKYIIALNDRQRVACAILSVFLILIVIVLRKWELSPFIIVWSVFAFSTCASQCIICEDLVRVKSIETFWAMKSFNISELAGAKVNLNLQLGSITIYTITGKKYAIPSAFPIKDCEHINHLIDMYKKDTIRN